MHDLALRWYEFIRVLQRTLNRTCVQRIENAHETRIRSTNTWASVYVVGLDFLCGLCEKSIYSVIFKLKVGIFQR